ncbi:DUF6082 family protein [Streptomyces sp. NBC_00876]|uniref:DUF6082 family protein n=1 Tax=Streptomyces sp. NBC_00876 TaxID=2975853 RepID=UPI003863CEB6|nr:DUF6082 family protein [Streptomyces sp. NBC_00876]
MPTRKPVDAVIGQMLRDASPEQGASEVHRAASMIADIGMRLAPTGADIDELRRLLRLRNRTGVVWRTRGRRFGISASRFLTDLAGGLARRGSATRSAVKDLGGDWRRRQTGHPRSLVSLHDMRLGLLVKAIDDPDLAATLDTYESEISTKRLRQFLFIEAVYRTCLLEWRVGTMTRQELVGNLCILFQNHIFRAYWDETRHHRCQPRSGFGRGVHRAHRG